MRTDRPFTQEADSTHQVRYPSILSEAEFDELEAHSSYQKLGTTCPTCEDTGWYTWNDERHECVADFDNKCFQWKLWRMYLLSNISDRYMRLDWEDIAATQAATKELVDEYLFVLPRVIKRGVGMYLYSTGLGTGKTFCATHILKEAAKLDHHKVQHRGYFVTFQDLLTATKDGDEWLVNRMKDTNILAIDDVLQPKSDREINFYTRALEAIVRPRCDNNQPTIITSNITWNGMSKIYPRVYSVLSDSVMEVQLDGSLDSRVERGVGKNINAIMSGEVPPIT